MTRGFLLLEDDIHKLGYFGTHRPEFEPQLSWSLTSGTQQHLKKKKCDLEEWGPRMSKRKSKME